MNEMVKAGIFCIIFFYCIAASSACSSNQNPYENELGIAPAEIAMIDTANYTTIQFEDSVVNFGKIKASNAVFVSFKFKNTGSRPLLLSEVKPSCGCTVVSYPKEVIQPDKEGVIKATLNTASLKGFVSKTIRVVANTKFGVVHKLQFQGAIE